MVQREEEVMMVVVVVTSILGVVMVVLNRIVQRYLVELISMKALH